MNILFAHVHITRQTQSGCHRRGRDAMLTSTGFRDDTRLTHALSQQGLPNGIAYLVCTGVIKVFALQINGCTTQGCRHTLCQIKRCGPPDKVSEILVKLFFELWVIFQLGIKLSQAV